MTDKYVQVHPDLLRDACLLHGLFDGPRCLVCAALSARMQTTREDQR